MSALSRVAQRAMQVMHMHHRRSFCVVGGDRASVDERMDKVNEMFAESRLLLQDATDALGTVYFEDDFNDAREATKDTIAKFGALVDSLSEGERARVLAANRPKMAQLEEELRVLTDTLIHDDH